MREPGVLADFLARGPGIAFAELLSELRADDSDGDDQDALMRRLRTGKRRAALLIGLADITEAWTLESVTTALSRFADLCVSMACAQLLRAAHADGDQGVVRNGCRGIELEVTAAAEGYASSYGTGAAVGVSATRQITAKGRPARRS